VGQTNDGTLDYAPVDELRKSVLRQVGMNYEDLRSQADSGSFSSDLARRAWLILDGINGRA